MENNPFVRAVRLSGMTAPIVVDGPVNGEWSPSYVDHVLTPTPMPGGVVILEDLPIHKRAAVREAIEAAGSQLLLLRSYSCDFNPIQNGFSKLKALLRKAAARTVDQLWRVIGESLDASTPTKVHKLPQYRRIHSGLNQIPPSRATPID